MFPALLWRPGPLRFAILVGGLWLFGTGEAMIVAADLGNSPWTVLAEGTAENTPLEIGGATVVISFLVLCAWVPLRQAPGLGTVMNAIVIGIALGVMVGVLPSDSGGWVAMGASGRRDRTRRGRRRDLSGGAAWTRSA